MNHILIQHFKIEYILRKHKVVTDNPTIRKYVNKIENRVTFRIKTGHYLELLMPGTMKLLGSTKSKDKNDRKRDKIGENVTHWEITEVMLVHCIIANNDYQLD